MHAPTKHIANASLKLDWRVRVPYNYVYMAYNKVIIKAGNARYVPLGKSFGGTAEPVILFTGY